MTKPLRLAFMGSPDFSVPVLAALIEAGHDIVCVYSQPPRPSGRGKKLTPTPVHRYAEENGIEVRTPNSLKSENEKAAFAALDLDAAVVVAYGLILPQAVLDAPRLGCMNLHASLLPRWRGAAPIQRAIMAGDKITGIQAMMMEAGLDTGPVLATETTEIAPNETAGSLHDRLSALGAQLAPRALEGLAGGMLTPEPQSEDGVTYAAKLAAADQRIDWSHNAPEIDQQIRGLSPFPGAWFHWTPEDAVEPLRIKALMSEYVEHAHDAPPGTLLDDDLLVACGGGKAVRLKRLQKPGSRAMEAENFLRGNSIKAGARFE
ncbi:methionyl-tRNA formyltransferase [Henriciella marina]|uniref:Methionyl-tRNA formyltransferase n=1 Tax=Henriciella marina TaxID=453851 RepID=A0ABT4LTI4_9PROT|nr:methionyl-tRNA formyltransferase [Henriciella marina]MCZ4297685.1 methionyl-tRNA formyltransferase [Henriciella marina]